MTEQATTNTQSATTTEITQASAPVAPAVNSPSPVQESAPATSWHNQLSDEYKQVKSFQNLKDVNDLAKMALNAQHLIGKKVQEWEAADVKAVYKKLGAPDNEDGYLLPSEIAPEDGKTFKQMALKAGLSVEQAKAFIGEVITKERENKAAFENRMKEVKNTWIKETQAMWGDPSTVEKRSVVAERALKDLGGDTLVKVLEETGIKDHPAIKKVFADIGTKYLYEHEVIGNDKISAYGKTPDDAAREMNMKLLDPEFRAAYYKAAHPQHKMAVEEMNVLRGLAVRK